MTKIRPDKKVGINWKNRQVLREIAAIRDREAQASYSPSYSAIEIQSSTSVHMARQVEIMKSLEKLRREKPGLIKVELTKQKEKFSRDRFLGPQLPIPWTANSDNVDGSRKKSLKEDFVPKKARKVVKDADADADDSPTESVMELLRERQRRWNLPSDKNGIYEDDVPEYRDTTVAYLRSSLSGIVVNKSTVVMKSPKANEDRSAAVFPIDKETSKLDFLAPQLQTDWIDVQNSRTYRHKSPAARMDVRPGREKREVRRKGQIRSIAFDNPEIGVDPLGPGIYDPLHGRSFGSEAMGNVSFQAAVSRQDAIGPQGQKPIRIVEEEREIRVNDGEELDLDHAAARDGDRVRKDKVKNIVLYDQVRYLKFILNCT